MFDVVLGRGGQIQQAPRSAKGQLRDLDPIVESAATGSCSVSGPDTRILLHHDINDCLDGQEEEGGSSSTS